MRKHARGVFVGVLCAVVLAGCGGGGGGGDESPGGPITPALSASVAVAFPNLFEQGGTKVLATYISHVATSERYPLARITIQNTGAPISAGTVSLDLPNYGSAATQTFSLNSGESKIVTLSPVINYSQLFQSTTALPAALNVKVAAAGATLFEQTYPIQITGRNTVFWQNSGQPVVGLVATMVTPQDAAGSIATFLASAKTRFLNSSFVGYQLGPSWPTQSVALGAGQYFHEAFHVLDGESPSVTIDGVAGGDNAVQVFIVDAANFQAWAAGSTTATACVVRTGPVPGATITCPTPSAGRHHVVYYNPNTTSRTVSRHRPMTKWEVTYYQTQAIFEELRARGLTYVNLTGTGYFAASQNVRYPVESLTQNGANCIDGALLFASAWEALGMEPVIAMSFQAGHAFAAVRCWAGTADCVIPVETTMVGGSASFADVWSTGATEWNSWLAGNHLQAVDVKAARALGLTPAPM